MKGSKLTWAVIVVAIALLALVRIAGGIASDLAFSNDKDFGFDLRMRRNEVRCAHQGVNSFRIWNREITLPGFVPLNRPDKPKVEQANESDATVHAYSPWHTAFFWFYGWLPEVLCLSLMSAVLGGCLVFIGAESIRLAKARFEYPRSVVAISLAIISLPAIQCFMLLNYCVLILSAFLLMNRVLERNHAILAGLAWAIMMIKPQVGLLFVWPLFWHRRYLTIATAAVVCLAGTLFTSFAVHESVIDLILQIPALGMPYAKEGTIIVRVLSPLFGESANVVGMTFFFVLTGCVTWAFRKQDFLSLCVPVVLIVPIWTYCSCYDLVILLPAYLLVYGQVLSERRFAFLKVAGCLLYAEALFAGTWSLVCGLRVFDPSGLGWIYRTAEYSSYAVMLAIAALFVRDSRHPAPPAASVHLVH